MSWPSFEGGRRGRHVENLASSRQRRSIWHSLALRFRHTARGEILDEAQGAVSTAEDSAALRIQIQVREQELAGLNQAAAHLLHSSD